MKTIAWCVLSMLFTLNLTAQSSIDPVSWDYKVTKEEGKYDLRILATMEEEWVIYSQFTPEGGPIPTAFSYGEDITLEGKTTEVTTPLKSMDEFFEINVMKFKESAEFKQIFTTKGEDLESTTVDVTYMSCNNKTCLPPKTITLQVNL